MKALKIIAHPVTLICTFLLLLISGKGFGGFYALYILLGLSHGVPHALFAIGGIALLLIGQVTSKNRKWYTEAGFNLAGAGLMVAALIRFFTDSKGYNDSTFHQTIPMFTFLIFGICILSLVVNTLLKQIGKGNEGRSVGKMV